MWEPGSVCGNEGVRIGSERASFAGKPMLFSDFNVVSGQKFFPSGQEHFQQLLVAFG